MEPQQHVTNISADEFPQAVLQRSRDVPVVVDFWAEWCGPCKTLSPMLEQAAAEGAGVFELVKIDVDQNQELSAQFGIQSIPTVIAFRDGTPVSQFSGAIPQDAFNKWLEGILPTELDKAVDHGRDAALRGDVTGAEHIFRQVLEQSPHHQEAGTSLASLLLSRGETEDALILLGKLSPTPEVSQLQAAARVGSGRRDDVGVLHAKVETDPADSVARIELASALAAQSEYEPALDHLLYVVRSKGEGKEDARKAMLDIFGVLGDGHPLTTAYRRQLASALF
ncbi:MAG: thioredoxin [Acidimicrobiia bacterium]